MTNIVQFPPQPTQVREEEIHARVALAGIRSLWQTGIVGSEACAIASQVCYLLCTTDKQIVSITWAAASKTYVTHGDDFLSGPTQSLNRAIFADGLIDLHTRCGLVNSLDKKFFNPSGNPRQHFSVPHPMRTEVFWDEHTPIFFRLEKFTTKEYGAFITRQIADRLDSCTTKLVLPRP